MGKTSIQWTEHTWNPTRGCSRISPGCVNCYAERMAARFNRAERTVRECDGIGIQEVIPAGPFQGFATMTSAGPRWTGKVELIPSMLDIPLRRKKPTVWFVNSISDLFHEALPDEAIDRVFAVMALAHWHTYQILTKRAERMRRYFDADGEWYFRIIKHAPGLQTFRAPLPHVHLGVSVEDQGTADTRIPLLLQTPAAVRFVSYEPALEPVDFSKWFDQGLECNYCQQWHGTEETALPDGNEEDPGFLCPACGQACAHLPLDERLDQIIVGGESGPGARPFDIAWARQTIAQCRAAGVACFVKQLGSKPIAVNGTALANGLKCGPLMREPFGHVPIILADRKGGDMTEWPEDLRVREMPELRR